MSIAVFIALGSWGVFFIVWWAINRINECSEARALYRENRELDDTLRAMRAENNN